MTLTEFKNFIKNYDDLYFDNKNGLERFQIEVLDWEDSLHSSICYNENGPMSLEIWNDNFKVTIFGNKKIILDLEAFYDIN